MKEHLTEDELALYSEFLQNQNNVKVPLYIVDHIKKCDKCATESVDLSFIADEITKELHFDLEGTNETKTVLFSKKNILSIAVSLLIFLSVWQIFRFYNNNNEIYSAKKVALIHKIIINNKKIVEPIENIIEKEVDTKLENNILLACYEPNKKAEQLIDSFLANSRGENIEVITPLEIYSKINKSITFEWKNLDNIELTIEIYNNKMKIIEDAEIIGNNYTLENISIGLYYWKLFNSDFDLLFFGKIIIK